MKGFVLHPPSLLANIHIKIANVSARENIEEIQSFMFELQYDSH